MAELNDMWERSLHITPIQWLHTSDWSDQWHRASTGSRYSTTDEQSCSIAAHCAGLWCLACQLARGGNTGDDAGQQRVLAGSAQLQSPLTNRLIHPCFGLIRKQKPSVRLHLNMKPNRVKLKAGGAVQVWQSNSHVCLVWTHTHTQHMSWRQTHSHKHRPTF